MNRPAALPLVLLLCWATPATAQLTLRLNAGYLDRRLAEGAAVERQAGIIGGGAITYGTRSLAVTVSGGGGQLRAKSPTADKADYARITGELTVALAEWLAASAGVAASVYVTPVGAQRWILPRIGIELRAPFASIPATAYFAGAVLLSPNTNALVRTRGGTDVRAGFATTPSPVGVFLEYHLERLQFAATAGREEQRGEVLAGLRISP